MTSLFGPDLPLAVAGEMTLYLLGPGVGESLIVVMPDQRVMVVDACITEATNLTMALLDHLRVSTVDLMAVTHPDLDHVSGLADVLQKASPKELWRYPLEARAREFALAWAKGRKKTALADALGALGRYVRSETAETFSVTLGDRVWPHDTTAFRVHALAPTTYDMDLALRAWDRRLARDPAALRSWLDGVAAGTRSLGDAPNLVSLALSIEFGARRILLGGDVLRGSPSPKSGWKGIERLLTKFNRLHLLQGLAVVKVAHHGSSGAFDAKVWSHHANGAATGEPAALIAPFSPSGLPDSSTLVQLRNYARLILLAHAGTAASRVASAGWTVAAAGHVTKLAQTLAPCVVLQLDAAGPLRASIGAPALAAA